MKHFTVTTLSALFLFALGTTTAFGVADEPEWTSTHGSACQPANLSQSINFGTNWNQIGVRNRNALGSNRFFFVVCPVVVPDQRTNTPILDTDVLVRVVYQDRDIFGGNRVACTGYYYSAGVLFNTVTTADILGTTGPGTTEISLTDLIPTTANGFEDHVSVVCSMPPQSTINGVTVDHD